MHVIFSPYNLLFFGSLNVRSIFLLSSGAYIFVSHKNACRISVFKIIHPLPQKSIPLPPSPLGHFETTLPSFTSTSYGASLVKLAYIYPLGLFFRWLFEWMSVHGYPLDIIPFEDWYKRYSIFFLRSNTGASLKLFSVFSVALFHVKLTTYLFHCCV